MPDLTKQFKQAQEKMNNLAQRPDNATALRLYALYKQATVGDASGERPGMFDLVRRAKYDAWEEVKGMAANDAMREYIKLAASLDE